MLTLTNLVIAFLSVKYFPENSITNGIIIGCIIMNCAGLTHDSGHRICSEKAIVNDTILWVFGNVGFGVNGFWWREEHDDHHGHPLTYNEETGALDK